MKWMDVVVVALRDAAVELDHRLTGWFSIGKMPFIAWALIGAWWVMAVGVTRYRGERISWAATSSALLGISCWWGLSRLGADPSTSLVWAGIVAWGLSVGTFGRFAAVGAILNAVVVVSSSDHIAVLLAGFPLCWAWIASARFFSRLGEDRSPSEPEHVDSEDDRSPAAARSQQPFAVRSSTTRRAGQAAADGRVG